MVDQWCIIHGDKLTAAGQCPKCTPLPTPGTPAADAAELQAKLDRVTQAVDAITAEFNKANAEKEKLAKELAELKGPGANKCEGCDHTACPGCKEASEAGAELSDKYAKAVETLAQKDEMFAEETKRTSDALDKVAELEAELESERKQLSDVEVKYEERGSEILSLKRTVSKLEGELAEKSAKDADDDEPELGLDGDESAKKTGGKKAATKKAGGK